MHGMIIDQVMMMLSASSTSSLSQTELRSKVSSYVELLSSAGKRDPDELALLGREYLRKIVEGPDSRFSGC
jgi:hypothetical protein